MNSAPTFALGSLVEAAAARAPSDRLAVVCAGTELTWGRFMDQARRFAGYLTTTGHGRRTTDPESHDSGCDHVALMLDNGPEFLECSVGASLAGAATFSVNTRYAAPEVAALLRALDARILVVSERLAPVARAAISELGDPLACLVVGTSYTDALADVTPRLSGDVAGLASSDRLVICTGGTTGTPKGVLWRSDDFFVAGLRGFEVMTAQMTAAQAVDAMLAQPPPRAIAPTLLVHFAAQAIAFQTLIRGGTVLLLPTDRGFDATRFVDVAERYEATEGIVIGEVTTRPIVEELAARGSRLPALRWILAGSTLLSARTKAQFIDLLPHVEIRDAMGASETGLQAFARATNGAVAERFTLLPGNAILDHQGAELTGEGEGVLARLTNRALGYYRSPEASAQLWRESAALGAYVTTGDTVQRHADGSFSLLGRGATTINTGGEKVFAQEVERAIAELPAVRACLVIGAPSVRWGREVQALVVWEAEPLSLTVLNGQLSAFLARYKLPKRVWNVDAIPALNNGKPDYAAAQMMTSGPVEVSSGA